MKAEAQERWKAKATELERAGQLKEVKPEQRAAAKEFIQKQIDEHAAKQARAAADAARQAAAAAEREHEARGKGDRGHDLGNV